MLAAPDIAIALEHNGIAIEFNETMQHIMPFVDLCKGYIAHFQVLSLLQQYAVAIADYKRQHAHSLCHYNHLMPL